MTVSAKTNKGLYISLVFAFLLLLAVYAIIVQYRQINKLAIASEAATLRKAMPAIMEHIEPQTAAKMALRSFIARECENWQSSSFSTIESELLTTFGKQISFVLLNKDHQPVTSQNLTKAELKDFLQFFTDFYGYHFQNKPQPFSHTQNFIQKYFASSISLDFMPNWINIMAARFKQENGIVLIASLVKPSEPKRIDKKFAMTIPSDRLSEIFHGSVFIFIPEKNYQNIAFLQQQFNVRESIAVQKAFWGNKTQILEQLDNRKTASLQRKFARRSTSSFHGVIEADGQILGYGKIAKLSSFNSSQDQFVAFMLKRRRSSSNLLFLIALTMVFLNCAIFIFIAQKLYQPTLSWQQSLSRKFILLVGTICLLPLSGLLLQSHLKQKLEEESLRREIFAKLDNQIRTIENNHKIKMNDVTIRMRLLNEKIGSGKLSSDMIEHIQNEAFKLADWQVLQIYISEKDGEFLQFNTHESWTTDATKLGSNMVKALLRFIKINLKIQKNEKSNEKEDFKYGMILEESARAMGVETLYSLAIDHLKLSPFKLVQGAVWSFVELMRDANDQPGRLIMYIINREPFVKHQITELQLAQPPKKPNIVFMSQNSGQVEKLAPSYLENHPKFLPMLLNLNKAGGVLNLTLDSGDERIFVSGRRLKEMNWIALAIHRQPKEKWTTINTRTTLALATAVYLLILIFYLSQWLQGFFLKPVLALEENARRITAGNYDLQSVINTEDEMGYLAKSFAKMAQDLKEKEFLGRFLSDIAKDAIAGKQTTKATRIEATILFSDIRSFTTLSETYAPEEIGLMLNSYMTVMEEVIEEHGGSIEKFIGDAIMALFLPRLGLPHPVVRATKAAHQMMKKLDEYNAQRKKEKRFTIKNGAGIASGELIMGTMGNLKGRKDYTVTGPTVNLAAEMEKWSKQTKHLPIVLCAKSRQIVQEYGINCNKLELENQLEAYEPGFANN